MSNELCIENSMVWWWNTQPATLSIAWDLHAEVVWIMFHGWDSKTPTKLQNSVFREFFIDIGSQWSDEYVLRYRYLRSYVFRILYWGAFARDTLDILEWYIASVWVEEDTDTREIIAERIKTFLYILWVLWPNNLPTLENEIRYGNFFCGNDAQLQKITHRDRITYSNDVNTGISYILSIWSLSNRDRKFLQTYFLDWKYFFISEFSAFIKNDARLWMTPNGEVINESEQFMMSFLNNSRLLKVFALYYFEGDYSRFYNDEVIWFPLVWFDEPNDSAFRKNTWFRLFHKLCEFLEKKWFSRTEKRDEV